MRSVLGARGTEVNRTDKSLGLMELIIQGEGQVLKK